MNKLASFGIIGAGKVGSAIITELNNLGLLNWVVERLPVSLDFLNIQLFNSIDEIADIAVDCIVIATNDSEINNVSEQLERNFRNGSFPKAVCHLSGAMTCAELSNLSKYGISIFAAHPMQTFGIERVDVFDNIAWGIEAEQESIEYALSFVSIFDGSPIILSDEIIRNKPIYHIIGVSAANFMQATVTFANIMAKHLELDSKVLLPSILKTAYENAIASIHSNEPIKLTGPLVRGDFKTLEKHINALSNNENITSIYKYFSLALAEIAISEKLIDSEQYNSITSLFQKVKSSEWFI